MAAWPSMAELTSTGSSRIMEKGIPGHPYDTDATNNNVVVGVTKGTLVGTTGGWAYKSDTGELWGNTNVASENSL